MKRYLAILLTLVLCLSLLAACGSSNSSSGSGAASSGSSAPAASAEKAEKNKDVLRVAANAEASTLDPSQTTDASSQQIFNNIFETLVYEDENQNVAGKLAESYEQVDDITYVFHLRQGV